MTYRATLGTVVFLLLAVSGARGQSLRSTAGAMPSPRAGAQASASSSSQAAPISRYFSDSTSKPQGQSFHRRESESRFATTDTHSINPRQSATAASSSGFATWIPKTPQPQPRFHPNSHFYFNRLRDIVIIEVPQFVTGTVVPQLIPGSTWVEPGLYTDPPMAAPWREPGRLAPFDPTPPDVVARMLAFAAIKKDDVVYDLGAGDGRVVIAAAKQFGVKAVGFEIDPGLVKLARENVRKQGIEKLVEIRHQDFLTADLSPASVVTLYLSYDGNLAVRPQLLRQLKPGARVVSHTFDMGDWQPKIVESYRDAAGDLHMLFFWEIGAPLVFSNLSGR